MRVLIVTTIFLAILSHHCVENFFNLPHIIEETLRDVRRKAGKTDESHFKQSPLDEEYDFIVVSIELNQTRLPVLNIKKSPCYPCLK